jgi:uncharacterized protein
VLRGAAARLAYILRRMRVLAVVLALALGGCGRRATGPCTESKACRHAGHELEEEGKHAAAVGAYGRGCSFSDAVSCFELARLHRDGTGTPPDPAAAQRLLEKACDLGLPEACSEAALHYLHADGGRTPGDHARGVTLLERGCAGRSGLACYNLCVLFRDGHGVPVDEGKSAALFTAACEREHGGGCGELGTMLMVGRGMPEDTPRAIALLEKACQIDLRTCIRLGAAYEVGAGVDEDLAKARQLYDRACGAGEAEACASLRELSR